jgi:mannose-6-phosphate isomerase
LRALESTIEPDDRPEGDVVLSDAEDHRVERITLRPGCRLSYQRHEHRMEHWFVVSGHSTVMLHRSALAVATGSAVDVPPGTPHRIANSGTEPLVFIEEVQTARCFGEYDIERLTTTHDLTHR